MRRMQRGAASVALLLAGTASACELVLDFGDPKLRQADAGAGGVGGNTSSTGSISTSSTTTSASGGTGGSAPACDDGTKNGAETDKDCGGGKCQPCAVGKGCIVGPDCETNACVAGTCVPAACNDHIKNGSETDIDCGGADCPGCVDGKACGGDGDCLTGRCVAKVCWPPSCAAGGPGLTNCGSSGTQSCCEAPQVPGGTFQMGRSAAGTDQFATGNANEQPEHAVTIAPFKLDLFEVTVGRFRQYVNAYPGAKPAALAGAHPLIPGSGWQAGWDANLPPDQAALKTALACKADSQTWTDTPAANESMAINCVTWYDAFAFCAWDGGYLPSEAEWEFAAAGGEENRLYPWGADAPSAQLANYNTAAANPYLPVGSFPLGVGRWGHLDLGGGMYEWTLDYYDNDWYSTAGASCDNCSNIVTGGLVRVVRGGAWLLNAYNLRSAMRDYDTMTSRLAYGGFRCARGQ